MDLDSDRIDDVVLVLLLPGLHDGDRALKWFDWDAMSRLHTNGLIPDQIGSAKAVVVSTKGKATVEALLVTLFGRTGCRRASRCQPDDLVRPSSTPNAVSG